MRVALEELLEKLGVDRVLSPYETQPWFYHDSGKGISCSAEVRMGPDNEDLEAEIQFLFDDTYEPPPEKPEETKSSGDDDEDEEGPKEPRPSPKYPQVMLMRALPSGETEWSPKQLFVKGKDYTGKFYDWEGKGCEFFRACIESVQMSELPDIEMLIERELSDDDGFGGGKSGRIGRKSPKIKPGQLLGMKKGM